MSNAMRLRDRIKYAMGRLGGIPVETDLSPYRATAAEAAAVDLGDGREESLASRAASLRERISSAASAREAKRGLPALLALAAEASRRGLGQDPYEAQLVAAAAMCDGKVAQLQTGEGKTLAAALAASFLAMRDGSVHVITANDYLARRDAAWMRPIYAALGLSVASISGADGTEERRAAYRSDVAYLTARELGFDYLRDGMAASAEGMVQRGFASAIVDEADFILIDEARVPLVIAGSDRGPGEDMARDCAAAERTVRSLVQGLDYSVDREGRKVSLLLPGLAKVDPRLVPRTYAALHAHRLLARDVDYVVKDGRIRLVDSFTGRVAERRQWPWGVQAALEAKEGLELGPEGRVYGSIAVQHLVGLYPRLAAMTATAVPAAAEFAQAYGMGTVIVPPVRPSRRRDEPDRIFWNRESKRRAIVAELRAESARGRPALVGTSSVRESEELAALLRAEGIACVVLNAKNDEEEARLVAAAGRRGAVTISTNMAGRGTDIRLADDPELLELGGLYVIGADKGESRRIDDQLRGRAGRQGDPGLTRFFVSLEDDLFRRYGVRGFLPPAYRDPRAAESGAIPDPEVAREVARAQSIIEGENSAIRLAMRKRSLIVEYDRRCLRELRDAAVLTGTLPPAVEEAIAAAAGPPRVEGLRKAMAGAFVARLDAAWADHLALVEDVKEGLGLQRFGGRDPGIEYVRMVGDAFEAALRDLEAAAIRDCLAILGGGPGTDAPAAPPRPSSTWTYAAHEDEVPYFDLGALFRAKV